MASQVAYPPGFSRSTRVDGAERILVVILHGWRRGPEDVAGVADLARQTLGPTAAVDLYIPELPYRSVWNPTRAADTVASLVGDVDRLAATPSDPAACLYGRIVLVGHGMGATLARRLFLAAHGPITRRAPTSPKAVPPSRTLPFRPEPVLDIPKAKVWAARVERIVLIAAFNRGWHISRRMSWSYATLFNAVGLVGHLMPTWNLTPAVFDFRLGAPFMAQTRLNWLAYRRHSDFEMKGPLLIQLLGSRDDLVSPLDQIDIAVDGLDRDVADTGDRSEAEKANRSLYLLELARTGHDDAVAVAGPAAPAVERRAVLALALTGPREALAAAAVDPDLLADAVDIPDRSVERTAFVIHGIRDDGFWTHRVAEKIREGVGATCAADAAIRSLTPTYGYFAMLPFILPWVRQNKVEWFMDQYVAAAARYPEAAFDYVGHSNGTYLGARALRDYPACHFGKVYFAGSVVRRSFDWAGLVEAGRVGCLLNVVATADWVVALLPKSVERWKAFDLGGAGFDGFDDAGSLPALMECRYVAGDHGAGIVEGHWPHIAAFVAKGAPMERDLSRDDLFGAEQSRRLRWWADLQVGLPLLAATALLVVPAVLCTIVWVLSHGAPLSMYLLALLVYALLVAFVVNRV